MLALFLECASLTALLLQSSLGDVLYFDFEKQDLPSVSIIGSATPATAPAIFYAPMGPAPIGGGDSLVFHLWYPAIATTAPSYEFEIGWWKDNYAKHSSN